MLSESASDHLFFFSVRVWAFEATFFGRKGLVATATPRGTNIAHRRRAEAANSPGSAGKARVAQEQDCTVSRYGYLKASIYKRVSIVKRKKLPQKQTPYTRTSLPDTIVLLPRDSEQVHVRLDVNIVSYRVNASERVCDLPVEVPD